eukprot:5780198-Amphidinium_carterae.1
MVNSIMQDLVLCTRLLETQDSNNQVDMCVSSPLSAPTIYDVKGAKQLIRYFRGTQGHVRRVAPSHGPGLNSDIEVHAFSDSDWAGCPGIRKSTTQLKFS